MGKYGIGARVRDEDGDEGVIVDKRKGERRVRYDKPITWGGDYETWMLKSELTPVEAANDNGSGAPAFKIGDRVRMNKDSAWWCPDTESVGTVVEPDEGSHLEYAVIFDGDTFKWHVEADDIYLDEPATAEQWVPKAGDRVRCDDNSGAPWHFVVGEFYTVKSVGPDGLIYVHETDGGMFSYRFTPAPLTIEAGRYYKTRDGRKVGPMVRRTHYDRDWPWTTLEGGEWAENTWREDGITYYHPDDPNDLIAEWVDEPVVAVEEVAVAEATATEREFKVGDRVQPISKDAEYVNGHYDHFFTKSYGESDGTYFVRNIVDGDQVGISAKNEGDAACYFFSSRFEPAAPAETPAAKFKVGDRVRVVDTDYDAAYLQNGEMGTVRTVEPHYIGVVMDSDFDVGFEWAFYEDQIELVDQPKSETITLTLKVDSEPLADAFRTIAAALNRAADDISAA